MKKIVFVNAHWNNRGDEAAIRAIIDSLLEVFADLHIVIVFKEKGEIKQFPYKSDQVKVVTARFLPTNNEILSALMTKGNLGCNNEIKKLVHEVEDSQLVVYSPGGAVISDRFWWSKQLEYLFPILYAEVYKIPIFFAAPSIGPFYKNKWLRNCILKKVNKIFVREEISRRMLEKAGVSVNVTASIDSAFLNTIDWGVNDKVFEIYAELKSFFSCYDKIVGVTITDFSWHVEYNKREGLKENIKSSFREFICRLGKEKTGVLLIPQLFGNQEDRRYLMAFAADNTFVLSDEVDSNFQQYVIAKLYAMVGMRYHSNIFAAKMGIPFVPIVYEEKMDGFLMEAAWEHMAVKLDELSAEKLWEKFAYIVEYHTVLSENLKRKRGEWKLKAEQTRDNLIGMIKELEV